MATYNISLTKGTGIASFYYSYYDSSNTYRTATAYSSLTIAAYSGTLIRVLSVTFSSGYTYPVTCGTWTMYNASGNAVDPTISVNANRSLTISATKQATTTKYSIKLSAGTGVSSFKFYYYSNGTYYGPLSSSSVTVPADAGTNVYISSVTPESGYGSPYTIYDSTNSKSWEWDDDPYVYSNGARTITISATVQQQTYYGRFTLNANGGAFPGTGYTSISWPTGGVMSGTGTGGAYVSTTLPVSTGNYVPTRDGYTFLGWATSSTATSADYLSGATVGFTAKSTSSSSPTTVTLYAVWKQTFTLSYKTSYSGVTNMPSAVTGITSGTGVTVSSKEPVLSGYTFKGWSLTDGGAVRYVAGNSVYVTADITLWTVFEKKQISLFYWDGASGENDAALIAKGQPVSNITATMWNNLLAKIKELADACGASFSYTTVSSGDGITAARFNVARTGLANINTALGAATTLPAAQASGNTVYATLFNGTTSIKGALNELIGVYNDG